MPFYGNIDQENLIGLVKNSAPFLFKEEYQKPGSISEIFEKYPEKGWLYILNSYLLEDRESESYTKAVKWYEYFLLCLSAHWASVMTFVPTDVDNKIRIKLWADTEKRSVVEKMMNAVFLLPKWDMSGATKRTVKEEELGDISGHNGEYLTVLGGAMGICFLRGWKDLAEILEKKIAEELDRENRIFLKYLKLKDKRIELLKVCAVMTHNVGDLLRAVGMWNCELSIIVHYKLKYMNMMKKNNLGIYYYEAGLLYKEFLVHDNGRHLALREPKCLRNSDDYLLPIGPFFEEWGEAIGRNPTFKEEDIIAIINALLDGAERIPLQKGYTRALAGMNRSLPKGLKEFDKKIQKQGLKTLKLLKIEEESKISTDSYYQRLSKKVQTFITDLKVI